MIPILINLVEILFQQLKSILIYQISKLYLMLVHLLWVHLVEGMSPHREKVSNINQLNQHPQIQLCILESKSTLSKVISTLNKVKNNFKKKTIKKLSKVLDKHSNLIHLTKKLSITELYVILT